MTEEKQRAAIAEACGWKRGYGSSLTMWCNPSGTPIGFTPNYPADLNAMHEAEKMLTKEQIWHYITRLVELTGAEWTDSYSEVMVVAHATAAQRAKAFLCVIGKWKS
jgi:hypothetical protein